MRVQILKDYVKQHFPATPLLDYALEVEKITTSKVKEKISLISNSLLWVNFLGKTGASLASDCAAKMKSGVLGNFISVVLLSSTNTYCQLGVGSFARHWELN